MCSAGYILPALNPSNWQPRAPNKTNPQRHATDAAAVLYHQTSKRIADIILNTQVMKPGTAGVAGGGIYFATTPELTEHKAHRKGVILEARVSLGRVHELDRDGDHQMSLSKLQQMGYDSVCINRGHSSGLEYVVYEPERVLEISRSRTRL